MTRAKEAGSVVIRFKGRLGNQLFQWATGLSVATRNGGRLYYQPTAAERPEILDLVDIPLVPGDLLEKTLGSKAPWGAILRRVGTFLPYSKRHFFQERMQGFDPAVQELRTSVFLDGYWQSWKYFAPLSPGIFEPLRRHLAEACGEDPWLAGIEEKVVMHVRRSDYVGQVTLLSSEYYRRALKLFPEREVLVVSDDPDYCQTMFASIPQIQVVKEKSRSALCDLNLMVRAQGVVIANSTFSWWGAYLNPLPTKTVVAPAAWFSQGPGREPVLGDLFPPDWKTVADGHNDATKEMELP